VDQNVCHLIYDILAMIRPQAMAKSLSLDLWIEPDTPFVVPVDAHLLRQILVNLLVNAIKFTEEGGIILRLSCNRSEQQERGSDRLLFEIIDTGIGISPAHLKRIFERFTQLDDSVTRRYSGTGLGTTITKQLVELMGGEIGVESHVGQGSRFWFELPLKSASTKDVDDSIMQTAQWMLFTDEDYQDSQILNYLEECDLIIKVITNSASGFQELLNAVTLKRPYDVVIVDEARLAMPVVELATTLRAERRLKELALLLVTREPIDQERKSNLRHLGFQVIISPPMDLLTFKQGLYYALATKGMPEPRGIVQPAKGHAGRRYSVLLVEDNYINQKVVIKILQRAGHRVTVADTGGAALQTLQRAHYDVVILDMQMPDMCGIDVIKRYREVRTDAVQMPFMMLTANATIDAQEQYRALGVHAFLTKPVRSSQLVDMVDEIMAGYSSAGNEHFDLACESESDDEEKQDLIIDTAILEDLVRLSQSPDFLNQLVERFFLDASQLLEAMEAALNEKNVEDYRELAHAMAGNAAGMGAHALRAACASVSGMNKQQFIGIGEELFTETSVAYDMTHRALTQYL
ncbi:MAG: ATP-binding protein, partial [Candidatus Promineifilaceae bacterium]